jgi:heptose I phosphotransferase
MHVAPGFQPIFREAGLDAEAFFTHPDIKPWRTLKDRENCTLDITRPDGSRVRFHIKRFPPFRSMGAPADQEVNGLRTLDLEGIPTAPLVGWGKLADRRSFVITLDLAGYEPADKLIESGVSFDRLLEPTADLTARLHAAGLHHCDLYLCHFFARVSDDRVDLRLIDAARVERLGLLARRWIIKDLAQFWYSTLSLPVTQSQRMAWLDRYAANRKLDSVVQLQRSIQKKSNWIARHDAELRKKQPHRNVSIPRND